MQPADAVPQRTDRRAAAPNRRSWPFIPPVVRPFPIKRLLARSRRDVVVDASSIVICVLAFLLECRHYLARDQRTAGTGDGKLADKKTALSTS